jgi:hypothetical protein
MPCRRPAQAISCARRPRTSRTQTRKCGSASRAALPQVLLPCHGSGIDGKQRHRDLSPPRSCRARSAVDRRIEVVRYRTSNIEIIESANRMACSVSAQTQIRPRSAMQVPPSSEAKTLGKAALEPGRLGSRSSFLQSKRLTKNGTTVSEFVEIHAVDCDDGDARMESRGDCLGTSSRAG